MSTPTAEERALHYDTLFEQMSEGFALCEAIFNARGVLVDYWVLQINPALQRMLGVGPEATGTKLSDSGHENSAWLALCGKVVRTGEPFRTEYHNRNTGRWHEIYVSKVSEDRIAQFFHDVTERKEAEAHQTRLFDELNHRVRNNLTMVSSILHMQARGAEPELRNQLLKAAGRVTSISDVHASLYQRGRKDTVEFGQYLRDLCAGLVKSLVDESGRVSLVVKADTAELNVDKAVALGMAVNELVTNAIKHAYPPPQQGEVNVRFSREGDGYLLTIRDSGRGLQEGEANASSGLGMKLVPSLIQQAGGALSIVKHSGTTFEIRLPEPA
jgi:two-component sensor histidine kinase